MELELKSSSPIIKFTDALKYSKWTTVSVQHQPSQEEPCGSWTPQIWHILLGISKCVSLGSYGLFHPVIAAL